MAERFLRERYGAEVQDHHVYAIVSDGDLMEGIAAEAASLAGQLGLGRLVYLYDDNDISLDGPTSLSFDREDVDQALRGLRLARARGPRRQRHRRARGRDHATARRSSDRPTLIRVKSIIGYPSPNKQGTSKAHGAPLGEDEVRADQGGAGLGSRQAVPRPRRRLRGLRRGRARRRRRTPSGSERFERLARRTTPSTRARVGRRVGGPAAARPRRGAARTSTGRRTSSRPARAGAEGHGRLRADSCRRWSAAPPTSRSRRRPSSPATTSASRAEQAGRNVFFGVREHGMGGAVNGMAAHGGIVRPVRLDVPAVRRLHARRDPPVSALTGPATSPGSSRTTRSALGEDGPTHQPVEHLAALRAIPGLVVLRPADANETAEAWRVILEDLDGPGRARPLAPGPAGARPTRSARRRRPRRLRAARGGRRRRRRRSSPPAREVWVALAAADAAGRGRHRRARGLDAVAGSSSSSRTRTTSEAVLPLDAADGLRRGRRRAWAGERWADASSRSTASALARPATRCSRSSASRPSDVEAVRALLEERAGVGSSTLTDVRPAHRDPDLRIVVGHRRHGPPLGGRDRTGDLDDPEDDALEGQARAQLGAAQEVGVIDPTASVDRRSRRSTARQTRPVAWRPSGRPRGRAAERRSNAVASSITKHLSRRRPSPRRGRGAGAPEQSYWTSPRRIPRESSSRSQRPDDTS